MTETDKYRITKEDIDRAVAEVLECGDECRKLEWCYIAIIDMGEFYDIEVEVDHGTIATTLRGYSSLGRTRAAADRLERALNVKGVHVSHSRFDWDN